MFILWEIWLAKDDHHHKGKEPVEKFIRNAAKEVVFAFSLPLGHETNTLAELMALK